MPFGTSGTTGPRYEFYGTMAEDVLHNYLEDNKLIPKK